MSDNSFSAAPSALGYLFQCRYAFLESLRRLRKREEFVVSIETLDDVVFEADGEALELLQTKHHLKRSADLTDASPDLWKTIRIWCERLLNGEIIYVSTFILITTAQAAEGSAAKYLKSGESRNVLKAIEHLNATAESSTNQANTAAYLAFRRLTPSQKTEFAEAIVVVDSVSGIKDMDSELREEIFFAVDEKFLVSYLQRLEGWWLQRVIKQLAVEDSSPILSEELNAVIDDLREQFKRDNLPIDEDIMRASVDASGYQDNIFVYQLRLIEIGNPRILHAIRNYFRAFEQRSRWIRDQLLLVGELDLYEQRLIEEWDILFQQMRDKLGEEATDEAKKIAAQALYEWVETNTHFPIRARVNEPSIARGTYQILSDNQRVGWHPEFVERLRKLLEAQRA